MQTLTGSPTISGDLVIASGTLSAGSNNLTVGGNWWNLGGMFIGTGTVTFNGTGTSNAIRSAGQDFGAVTVSGTGKWTADDRLSVAGGALAVGAGTLDVSGYTVRAGSISTGGTFTTTGSTVIVDGAVEFDLAGARGRRPARRGPERVQPCRLLEARQRAGDHVPRLQRQWEHRHALPGRVVGDQQPADDWI